MTSISIRSSAWKSLYVIRFHDATVAFASL